MLKSCNTPHIFNKNITEVASIAVLTNDGKLASEWYYISVKGVKNGEMIELVGKQA